MVLLCSIKYVLNVLLNLELVWLIKWCLYWHVLIRCTISFPHICSTKYVVIIDTGSNLMSYCFFSVSLMWRHCFMFYEILHFQGIVGRCKGFTLPMPVHYLYVWHMIFIICVAFFGWFWLSFKLWTTLMHAIQDFSIGFKFYGREQGVEVIWNRSLWWTMILILWLWYDRWSSLTHWLVLTSCRVTSLTCIGEVVTTVLS